MVLEHVQNAEETRSKAIRVAEQIKASSEIDTSKSDQAMCAFNEIERMEIELLMMQQQVGYEAANNMPLKEFLEKSALSSMLNILKYS